MAARRRESQYTGSAQESAHYEFPCNLAANGPLLGGGGIPDSPQCPDIEHTGEFNSQNNPSANPTVFSFENSPAHGIPVNATEGLSHYPDLTNYAFLQPLPWEKPSQLDRLYHGNSPPPVTSGLLSNENRGFSSTPSLPTHPGVHRGLPRRKSRYLIQEIDRRATATFIPSNSGSVDPLERWKNSPPEAEAASLSAIQNALENPSIYATGGRGGVPDPLVDGLFQTHRRAGSTTSGESATSASSHRSNRSDLSGLSNGSQRTSDRSSAGIRKKLASTSRRKRTAANNPRIFCCTFCCDKFKNKYDWMRHENSLHLNLENWTCAPFGGSVVLPSTGRVHCAYCNQLDPTPVHLEQHNYGACQEQTRKFHRKDHLVQHLRLFHHLDTMPLIDDWKQVITDFSSRCGFCGSRMLNWEERADHLTAHFRQGCTMAHWKGDHDFPPDIAVQVKYSVPPYLLDFESRTFVPFSATNGAVNDHLSQMLSRASFINEAGELQMLPESDAPEAELQPVPEPQLDSYTEVLTSHLSHYARQMMTSGIVPTDEMFQEEARRLLFDSEDQWNQTMADNLEWLAKFRGEQSSTGGVPLQQVPDDPVIPNPSASQ